MDALAWKPAALMGGLAIGAAIGPPLYSLFRHIGQTRSNFRGERIPTSAGVLLALPALVIVNLIEALPKLDHRDLIQAAVVAGFCLLGFLDDRWGTPEYKGLRGHLRALGRGRLTTGLVKALGGLGIAAAAAAQLHRGATVVAATLAIALSANAFNLLDLRPLRALKAFWLGTLALATVLPITHVAVAGVSLPYAREEGRRRVMLGDAGSNLLGSMMGSTAVLALPGYGLWVLVFLLGALHVWAEKHSLTAWIAARPWATAMDNWGVSPSDPVDASDPKGKRPERDNPGTLDAADA